jgi:O-antigen/teichoic acid export membrane protein
MALGPRLSQMAVGRRFFRTPELAELGAPAEMGGSEAVLGSPLPADGAALPHSHKSEPPSIWRSVRRDATLLGIGSIGIVVAQLAFRSILIAVLVPAAYGRLSLILSLYNTVMIIGASGLPNSAARYIALGTQADDPLIVRSVFRAGIWPTVVAATITAVVAGLVLRSPLSCLFAVVGLSCMVYSLVTMGILRGRGHMVAAASIMPTAGLSEVSLLALLWLLVHGFTPLDAFGIFCLGNVLGLSVGLLHVARTRPRATVESTPPQEGAPSAVPTHRELLGFSMWLGAATVGISIIPLIMRFAAALDSYSTVAVIDVAIVVLGIPQRVGAVIVQAVIPHATRALRAGKVGLTISRREHLILTIPFLLLAAILVFTPIAGWVFGALGRPAYAKSGDYLALALLAAPARVLYGLVEGMLVARGEGKFMALNALSISAAASAVIVAIVASGRITAAFAVFAISWWAIYLSGLSRIHRRPTTIPELSPT